MITAPHRCPRCLGSLRPIGAFDVCDQCAADIGWDVPCVACLVEDVGVQALVEHLDDCDRRPAAA